MNKIKIELTEEQKKCVEYPLSEQVLIIDADPGTGKTEILRHRVKFICQQNKKKRKFILVLAVGRNISKSIKRKLKAEGLKKIHHRLKSVLPEFFHKPQCEDDDDCLECLEKRSPTILTCTVHSIAYWIIRQVFAKLQEKKKPQILTNAYKKELSMLYMREDLPEIKEKIHWTTQEVITRKRRIFNYLTKQITSEKLTNQTKRELWTIFREEIKMDHETSPYYYWNITNYSDFLVRAKSFLGENKLALYQELVAICQENQNKNIWLSFDDIIENVLLLAKKTDNRINWPNFDYVLVDECQDLQLKLLNLITQIFSHQKTNFTFVGDPKQNIMAFAGATEDIFKLLKERFPDCVQMEISISFRVPQEIAAMANNFTSKFMSYRPKLTTNQANGGKKPIVFLAGEEKDYQLTSDEENEIKKKTEQIVEEENESENKKAKKLPKLEKKLLAEEVKAKKLKRQIEFILEQISKLDKSTSRVILYRKNEIGNWLKNWFIETNYHDFVMIGDNQNRVVSYIIKKIEKEIKDKPLLLNKFNSIEDFLSGLGINWRNIPRFQMIVEQFDQERILDEERASTGLTKEEVNEFIRQIDNQLTEKDIENTGKTILSTIHKAKGLEFDHVFVIAVDEEILPSETKKQESYWIREEINLFFTAITRAKKELYLTASTREKCSRFIKCLNPDSIQLLPVDLPMFSNNSTNYLHLSTPYSSIAEIIGERSELEVLEILNNSSKINFEKLSQSWEKIEELQIDIYAETAKNIYFIEIKNWSESFYYSLAENSPHYQKIWEQQTYRQAKITENFNSTKPITYLISFPNGEIAHDFQKFLDENQNEELLVVHHDQLHGKVWKAEYNLKRIDHFIEEKEKNSPIKKIKSALLFGKNIE